MTGVVKPKRGCALNISDACDRKDEKVYRGNTLRHENGETVRTTHNCQRVLLRHFWPITKLLTLGRPIRNDHIPYKKKKFPGKVIKYMQLGKRASVRLPLEQKSTIYITKIIHKRKGE